LNVLNAGIYETTDITTLKSNAKQHFIPQRVKINRLKLMVGNLFVDDVSTKDHSRKIYTTTFTTIGKYLDNNELLSQAIILGKDGSVTKLI
jgi:hypothetical protein